MADGKPAAQSSSRNLPKGVVRKRNPHQSSGSSSNSPAVARRSGGSTSGMMRLYTDDSPGLLVDPVTVLVFSLMFIGAVFLLHIWGKFTRG